MPVGRNTQEPDLANPAPGTRRKKPKRQEYSTKVQQKAESKLRDKGGMGVALPMTPFRSGIM
jgi:hypothetical protein